PAPPHEVLTGQDALVYNAATLAAGGRPLLRHGVQTPPWPRRCRRQAEDIFGPRSARSPRRSWWILWNWSRGRRRASAAGFGARLCAGRGQQVEAANADDTAAGPQAT